MSISAQFDSRNRDSLRPDSVSLHGQQRVWTEVLHWGPSRDSRSLLSGQLCWCHVSWISWIVLWKLFSIRAATTSWSGEEQLSTWWTTSCRPSSSMWSHSLSSWCPASPERRSHWGSLLCSIWRWNPPFPSLPSNKILVKRCSSWLLWETFRLQRKPPSSVILQIY